jgi:hypothetical protein
MWAGWAGVVLTPRAAASATPRHKFLRGVGGSTSYQTTIGWSLLSSGVVTLLLKLLPGDSLWWGLLLLTLGAATLYVRE